MAANGALRELVVKVKFALEQSSLNKTNQAIAQIKQKLAEIKARSVKVNVETGAANGKVAALKNLLNGLKGRTVRLNVTDASIGKINALKSALASLSGRSVTVRVVVGSALNLINRIKDAISSIPASKTVHITVDATGVSAALGQVNQLISALQGLTSLNAALGNLHLHLTGMTVQAQTVHVHGNGGGGGGGNGGNDDRPGGIRHLADRGMEITGLGMAMVGPLGYAVRESMKFESAMADVRKVVDFDTDDQFKGMKRDIAELSTKIPMTKEEIASMVAAGGQSGIERENLLDFATSSAKMGVAFDISADQAGEAMAQMRTMFKLDQKEVESLSDAINHLGNNTAAASPKILNVLQRVGSLGEVAGFTPKEIAGLGTAIVGIGIAPEVAATGIQNMARALTGAKPATKDAVGAFARLGLTMDETAANMQVDAKATTLDILERLSQLDKVDQLPTMNAIFGTESIDTLAPLLTNLDNLKNAWGLVANEEQYAGSMEAEFQARAGTSENSMELLSNRLNVLAGDLGAVLIPAMNRAIDILAPLIKEVQDFAAEHPDLTAGILGTVTALGGLLIGLGGIGLALGGVVSAFEVLAPLFTGAGGLFSIGFAPLLAILGLVAAAIYFIAENWDTVVEWFKPGLDSIMEGLDKLAEGWEAIQPLIDALTPLVKFLATLIGGALVGALSLLWRFGAFVFKGLCWAVEILASALGKVGELIQWLADGLTGLIGKAADFLGMKGSIEGLNKSVTQSIIDRAMASSNNSNSTQTQNNTFNLSDMGQLQPAMNTSQSFFAYQ